MLTTSLAQLAGVVRLLDGHLAANKAQLAALVESWMPELLAEFGVGPVAAAQLLVSWSHPGRCRSAAAFAMLAGTTPLQASSGRVTRHRLNRGGDRQLNRVYNRHRRWSADGTWEKVLDGLRGWLRCGRGCGLGVQRGCHRDPGASSCSRCPPRATQGCAGAAAGPDRAEGIGEAREAHRGRRGMTRIPSRPPRRCPTGRHWVVPAADSPPKSILRPTPGADRWPG